MVRFLHGRVHHNTSQKYMNVSLGDNTHRDPTLQYIILYRWYTYKQFSQQDNIMEHELIDRNNVYYWKKKWL